MSESGRWRVPFAVPEIGEAERAAAATTLASGWPALGPRTYRFEAELAGLAGTTHAIAVSSGTAALHLVFAALRLAPGDEVIVPSLTFVATANAVVAAGGRPVFADIESLDDPCVSVRTVEPLVGPRTRAVVAVHYGGMPCETGPLGDFAAARGLVLVEDASHAPGAALDGRPVGSLGHVACFSFYANKNLTTIEGGAVTTSDPALAGRVRALRSHGMTALSYERLLGASPDRDVLEPGLNYRIDDVRAAIGSAALPALAARSARRAAILARYRAVARASGFVVPFARVRPGRQGVAHLAAILARDERGRRELVGTLEGAGVQTSHHYLPAHLLTCYRSPARTLAVTEEFAAREVTLPLFSTMSEEQVALVCEALARGGRGR